MMNTYIRICNKYGKHTKCKYTIINVFTVLGRTKNFLQKLSLEKTSTQGPPYIWKSNKIDKIYYGSIISNKKIIHKEGGKGRKGEERTKERGGREKRP